jgi:uncharacterized membrane protein
VPNDDRPATGTVDDPERLRNRAHRVAFPTRWLVGLLAFAWYTAFSLQAEARHLGSFDLSVFDQAIANLAQLRAPVSTIKGFDLLGDHFHPIIAIVAPFYRVFPHASTLLVVQAAALGLSVVIVTKAAQEIFGSRCGIAIGVAYSISWGLQSALYFGFHEVSLGVPIIAGAAARYLRRDWARGTWWAVMLLLVKEDLALTVAAFGVYLCIQREFRHGLALLICSIGWFFLVIGVVVPALNPYGRYLYWPGGGPVEWTPGQPTLGLDASTLWSWQKVLTVFLLLAPMLFLALRSWLAIVMLPTLGWRFLSANPHYWGTKYHYNEILMPITFLAGAAGALRSRHSWRLRHRTQLDAPRTIAVGALVVGLAIGLGFPFAKALAPSFWRDCARCRAANAAASMVPSGATVTADDSLLAELVDRDTVYVLAPALVDGLGRPIRTTYVLIDTEHTAQYNQPGWLTALQAGVLSDDYAPIFNRDGYVLYHKVDDGSSPA